MDKKRIAIITLYYKNNNYGGVAQAYALYKYLSKLGNEVKLISFAKKAKKQSISNRIKKRLNLDQGLKGLCKGITWIIKWIFNTFIIKKIKKLLLGKYQQSIEMRERKFEIFRDQIPHTEVVTETSIGKLVQDFDLFVSGSDQIWKPSVVQEAFVLGFVPDSVKKVSYASSITTNKIGNDKNYCDFMKKYLSRYHVISVREKDAKDELNEILDRNVELVVDPTLLLDCEEWETISAKRLINEKYIFTYFLGNSKKQKEYVEKFAKKNKMAIVNLPFVSGEFNFKDCKYAQHRLFDIGLPEFFSLIKYAEIVFTDSFHAICFSWIFKKKFYVFDRNVGFDGASMNSRIDSILELMNLEKRKIDTTSVVNINDAICFNSRLLEEKIIFSRQFIEENF